MSWTQYDTLREAIMDELEKLITAAGTAYLEQFGLEGECIEWFLDGLALSDDFENMRRHEDTLVGCIEIAITEHCRKKDKHRILMWLERSSSEEERASLMRRRDQFDAEWPAIREARRKAKSKP